MSELAGYTNDRCFVRGCTDTPAWQGVRHGRRILICDRDRWRVLYKDRQLLPGAKTDSVHYRGTEHDIHNVGSVPVDPAASGFDVSRYGLYIDGEEISTNEFVKPLIDALTQYAQGDEFTEATIKVRKQ